MTDNLLNQILQNQNDTSEKIGGITEIVKRHDEVTFPDMQNTLTRMESKSNQDYLQFVEDKEKIYRRLEPLEADFNQRKKRGEAIASGSKAVLFKFADKLILVLIGMAIVAWERIMKYITS